MKESNDVLESRLLELEKVLNTDNVDEINENELKLLLYNILRECLIKRDYELEIGHFTINLTPQKLGVIYEDDNTYIEVSNDDVYEESERFTEVRYFVIDNNKDKEDYDANISKTIRSYGTILNINGSYQEIYELELFSQFETDEIMNYIKPDAGSIREETQTLVYITRPIEINSPRTDVVSLLAGDNIIPVTYYERENIYVPNRDYYKNYEPNNYTELVPDNRNKLKISRMIYSCIIEYYTEFMKEHS